MTRFLRRKWLFRSAFVLLVVALATPLAVWYYLKLQGQSRLDAVIHALDESDPGWKAAEICAARNASLPPKEKNSFTIVSETRAVLPSDINRRKDPLENARQRPANFRLRDNELIALGKHLTDCQEALAAARRLADSPEGGRHFEYAEFPLNTDLSETERTRTIALILTQDAYLAAHEQRGPDAIRNARAILNAGRAVGDEPFPISQLVRSACAAVACRTTGMALGLTDPRDGLDELQAELLREADYPRLYVTMRSQRAESHQTFQQMEHGNFGQNAGLGGTPGRGSGLLSRISGMTLDLPGDHAYCLQMMTAFVEASRKPADEQWPAFKAALATAGNRKYVFSSLLARSVQKIGESAFRVRGELLATAVAIACERHRQRTGKWPESLDEIDAAILPKIPNDPFTGRPICFKRLPDGVVVYSVGPNEKDDGGQVYPVPDGSAMTDFGVRLWDPAMRRQPPPKEDEPGEGENEPGGRVNDR